MNTVFTYVWLTQVPCIIGYVGTQLATCSCLNSAEWLLSGTPRVILADWRAISSSFISSLAFCSQRHRHSWTIDYTQQNIRKAKINGEITVRIAHATHSTHPHRKVFIVVEVETDLLPYESVVTVVISYYGISVYWLRQARANRTCFWSRLDHTFQKPLKRLARRRKMITRTMQIRLMMAVAQKKLYPFTCLTPSTMKTTIPPKQPTILHISLSSCKQQLLRIFIKN